MAQVKPLVQSTQFLAASTLHSTEGSGLLYRTKYIKSCACRSACLRSPAGRKALHWRASRQQLRGHGPQLKALPEAGLDAVSRSTQPSTTYSHTRDRNRTGGSSAGPRVSGNRTTQRLPPGSETGRQQAAPPVPTSPPLFPWLLMLPRCASLGFPDSRVPALDHVLPAMRFSHRLPDGCSSTARGDFLGKLSHLS